MTDNCCNPEHPLVRDGTSQARRAPAMLDPSQIKLDDRELRHLLIWAKEYAAELVFYNARNTLSGDWVSFVRNDPTTLIAIISVFDYRKTRAQFFEAEQQALASGAEDVRLAAFKRLCDKLIELALLFDGWIREAPPELLIYEELKGAIKADLAPAVRRLKAYDAAAAESLTPGAGAPSVLSLDYGALMENDALWGLNDKSEVLGGAVYEGATFGEQISNAVARVSAIHAGMLRILVRTVTEAPRLIEDSLNWPSHQPHMALMIAFLKIFEFAQASLNKLPERHLKHYYETILRLGRKESVPDAAHLVFTLANNQQKGLLLAAGTEFKAGKDAQGKELRYRLERNVALNGAQVSDIRAVYTQVKAGETSIHTSAAAASADGDGMAFVDPDKAQWLAFGQDDTRPGPTVGLVIASPILRLAEGRRTIILTCSVAEDAALPDVADLNRIFEASLSTATGWLAVGGPTVTVDDDHAGEMRIVLTFELSADKDPIETFGNGSEFAIYDTQWPLLKLSATGDKRGQHFEFLASEALTGLSLTVDVKGMAGLVLETPQGPAPVGKPFQPFGSAPKASAAFMVGNWEAAQKQLTEVTLNITWEEVPSLATHYAGYGVAITNESVTCAFDLLDRQTETGWTALTPGNNKLFRISQTPYELQAAVSDWARSPALEPFARYDHSLPRGFMRVTLQQDLLHDKYLPLYTAAAVALAKAPSPQPIPEGHVRIEMKGAATTPTLPNPPFTPVATSVTLSYKAHDTWNLTALADNTDVGQLFHIHPFGHWQAKGGALTLLPPLSLPATPLSQSGNGAERQRGELLLGLQQTPVSDNGFTISLLLHVAEGTEDPQLVTLPTVVWSYLAQDQWVDLEPDVSVDDGTKGFIRSGIVTLKIGGDASTENTILPTGRVWLRAMVERDPAGVCDMIGVHAQAGKVVFRDNANAVSHLAEALPAQTIAKMVNKDARVAAILQPYASFGGRQKEQDAPYFIRVAERLRHKERALSIWDYERLVLEHFPSVYKVKCISHATADREVAPGKVAVVVIPNVRNASGFDRIKPYASQSLRDEIRSMLAARSPHNLVQCIDVLNPVYEEIETEFAVEYNDVIPDFDLASAQLRQDLVRFLSPWAFSEGRDIAFGNKIHASAIIDFLDERPYVESVHDFQMRQIVGGEPQTVVEAAARSARSILVPATEASHVITARRQVA